MIVVFDAECLLCSAWVQFLLRHDKLRVFRFASMQQAAGRRLLAEAGLEVDRLETLLLVTEHGAYRYTSAIFRVLHQLGWPWRLAWMAWVVPAPIRDPLYRWLARNRYRWFGRRATCFVPDAGDAERFLDE
jgi:predicted DCC family thiol-disulfide oxidoreductase YuxK